MNKNLIKGTLLGLVGLVLIRMNSVIAEEPCIVYIDYNEEYIEYGDSIYLYPDKYSNSCDGQYVSCDNAGDYLWNWYSDCTVININSPTVLDNGDLKVCGTEYVSDDNGASGCITIMDRNLGATSNDIESEDSRGYLFQWGNNYGFPYDGSVTRYNQRIDCSGFGPSYTYSSSKYFQGGGDYCLSGNNNMWGGGNDNDELIYPVINPRNRQGPCPDGYHVPSLGEWHALMDFYLGAKVSENEIFIDDEEFILQFQSDFMIPFAAGRHNYYDVMIGQGYDAYYWSSTPYLNNSSYYFLMGEYQVNIDTANRSDAYSVRCFKDSDIGSSSSDEYIVQIEETMTTTIGETVQQGLPTPTITTNTVNEVAGKPVLGELNVDFGTSANVIFSHPVQVNIPVNGPSQVIVKVKHGGDSEYGFAGLTTNSSASCSNGEPTSNQYNGETINVVDGYATIYSCAASSFIALGVEGPSTAQIILSVRKGTLTIGTETGNLNLGEVNVSNSAQTLSGSFGENSFWVEDMKGLETGYYTTISVTDLTGTVPTHVISANNVYLKTAGNEPSYITGATVSDSKVVFGDGIKSWHSGSTPVNYFQRLNTASQDAGRVGKWGDDLQIKVTIPAHTPFDTYRGTITYTLYDNDGN